MKNLFFLALLFIAACTVTEKNKAFISGDIEPGTVIIDELAVKTPKIYTVTLDSNSFVYGVVNQISVDVIVKIKEGEKEIRTFDGPGEGVESFMFETTKQGEYSIEVAPFKKDSGKYTIELKIVEPIATIPEKRMDQLFDPYTGKNVPGGAVGVVKDGKLVFSKAYGIANLTYDIEFDINTPTNIGSVTKQFTATAILLLEQQGKLSLEDDIRKHLPELPDLGEVVKVKNLLNHTNGLWEIFNLMPITGWKGEDVLLRDQIIDIIQRQDELQAKPGEEFNYNNTAFILLAEIIKRKTDIEFPTFVKENVFEPLEMNNSFVRDNPKEIIKNASQGYVRDKVGFKEAGDLDASYGAGGIYTTVEDLAKWMNNFDVASLGGKELVAKLVTPDTLTNGDTLTYGFGIGVDKYKGLKRYSHGGADIAHRAFISYFPEINSGTIVLSNFGAIPLGAMVEEINKAFLGEYFNEESKSESNSKPDEVKVPMELLTKYSGKYLLEIAGMIIDLKIEDEKLVAIITGQPKHKLIALNDTTFKVPNVDAKFHIVANEDGTIKKAILEQNGKHELRRLPDYSPDINELAVFKGEYLNKQLETIYTIKVKDSTLVASHINLKDIKLEVIEEDSFKGDVFFMNKIIFNRNKKGVVESFSVSSGRTKNIVFVKQ
ncbi:MAG: beta-lactamase family protein [Prolixibacteraceae bacterium]|jgi:CubicO group peptidase (beta-lactamase class C family)|nr:beta-lactamase family protein [Prolixibacteraceae bacterium]MBT6006751.1 beta-lactamase family protein [Prolixibacteraceae bacterium]MBT6764475.1 beta-lactamase family protein [Prolixibacteraceae bacterium]MBT6999209.1 beta-lactamase family protein [Prolixibacteraceae bacterium]MBT7393308.1 beta-lactamase family protein [Prolixibacteraceae bacterium]